jgi:hypothetical protein
MKPKFDYAVDQEAFYPASLSNSTNPFNPQLSQYYGIWQWFFSVHYLSLCAGYLTVEENLGISHLACEEKTAGWTFTTDDPFIVNWAVVNGTQFPVAQWGGPPVQIHTLAPIVTLVIGISFLAFAITVCIYEMCIRSPTIVPRFGAGLLAVNGSCWAGSKRTELTLADGFHLPGCFLGSNYADHLGV